jgi:hypothetical protein
MDSIGTAQLTESPTPVRRVAIIGRPPGLGMGPTLIAASPRFRSYPLDASAASTSPRRASRSSGSNGNRGPAAYSPRAAATGSGSVAAVSRRNWCTKAIDMLPSPTAAATRFTGP